MKPSQQVLRAARIREKKRGVGQRKPKLLIDDVLKVLDQQARKADLLDRELANIKVQLAYPKS